MVRAAAVTVVTAGVITGLYYGQIVLIPVALSILLSFLLTPAVRLFERLGLNRVLAVLAVGLVAYTVLAATAWILTLQTASLVEGLPQYRENIREKVADVRGLGRGGKRRSESRCRPMFQANLRNCHLSSRSSRDVGMARWRFWGPGRPSTPPSS